MMSKILRATLCAILVAALLLPIYALASGNVKILNVTVDGARVRNENREIITSLKSGTKVFYLGKKIGSNSLVRISNGLEGYVYDGFLESYGAVKEDSIYYCSESSAKVYRYPSSDAKRLGSLSENQYVVVLRTRGDWAYIKNLNGKGGFCKLDSLTAAD